MDLDPELGRRGGLARRLVGGPARIRRAAIAAAEATPEPGNWTAQQVVLHLVAVETEVVQERLRQLSELDSPEWVWVEPGPAAPLDDESLADSLLRFAAARLATLDWVAALDDAGWSRSGQHATLGRLDVAGLLAVAADHDAEHLAGLAKLARSAAQGERPTR